jgi:hypothetical protein
VRLIELDNREQKAPGLRFNPKRFARAQSTASGGEVSRTRESDGGGNGSEGGETPASGSEGQGATRAATSFRDVLWRMEEDEGGILCASARHGMQLRRRLVINPVLGPEAITGSSRLKVGGHSQCDPRSESEATPLWCLKARNIRDSQAKSTYSDTDLLPGGGIAHCAVPSLTVLRCYVKGGTATKLVLDAAFTAAMVLAEGSPAGVTSESNSNSASNFDPTSPRGGRSCKMSDTNKNGS